MHSEAILLGESDEHRQIIVIKSLYIGARIPIILLFVYQNGK